MHLAARDKSDAAIAKPETPLTRHLHCSRSEARAKGLEQRNPVILTRRGEGPLTNPTSTLPVGHVMKNTEELWSLVDAKERAFAQLSDRVWGMPELCCGSLIDSPAMP